MEQTIIDQKCNLMSELGWDLEPTQDQQYLKVYLKQMKIIVTGSTGFIGKHLYRDCCMTRSN